MIHDYTWPDLVQKFGFPAQPRRTSYEVGPHGLQKAEYQILAELVRLHGARRILELGTAEGYVGQALLREIPAIDFYLGIDIPPDTFTTVENYTRQGCKELPGWAILQASPRAAVMLVAGGSFALHTADLPRDLDAVLVDGEHTGNAAKHDTELVRGALRPGGLLVWHDALIHPQVTAYVSSLPDDICRAGNIAWTTV
jgi:predicted O-methyltransferase YrrM